MKKERSNKYSYFTVIKTLFPIKRNNIGMVKEREIEEISISFKIFYIVSRITNISFWSILIGIISGVAVNLFTNNLLDYFYLGAILLLFFSVIIIVILIRLFETFNNEYDKNYRDNINSSKPVHLNKLWEAAIIKIPEYKRFFLQNISIALLLIAGALVLVIVGNNKIKESEQVKEKSYVDREVRISSSHDQIISELKKLSDSLEVLKKKYQLFLDKSVQSPSKKQKK